MAISQNFPEEGPTLNLNFAGSRTLDPRITFSRSQTTSNGSTYMDQNGLIRYAGPDEPRFDHRYVNGEVESLGLLVEEQRTNLILYSNDFSQSNWTKQNSHPTPSKNAIGPDGVANSASTVYRTATNQYLHQQIVGGGTYTLSAWVKSEAATGSFIMQAYNATDGETGKVTHTATNEWQRFETTMSPTTNSTYYPCIPTNINTNFYVWGVQVESGTFPTSYIPTEGSTKTRNPDNVSMTGTNFSDWYNPTEGTVFLDCTPVYDNSTNVYRRLLSIHNNSGSQTDVIQFIQTEQSNQVSCAVWDGSSFQTGFGKVVTSGTRHKVAFAVKENNMNASYDGNIGTDDTTCTLPVMTQMDIGKYANASSTQTTIHINNISYYPTRLTNSQLQNLTK